jgi:tetratricopeptide (TPR) repeat protein
VAIGLNTLGRFHAAKSFSEEALRLVRDERMRGYALHAAGQAHYNLGNILLAEMVKDLAAECAGDDRRLQTYIRDSRVGVLVEQGRLDEAIAVKREVLKAYEDLGELENATRARYSLGEMLVDAGKVDEGLALLRDANARSAESGDPRLRAQSQLFYGRSLYKLGRNEDAVAPLESAFRIAVHRDMSEQAFHAAFHLWKLSDEKGYWLEEALRYRAGVDQRSEETEAFDAWLVAERRKPRRGRRSEHVM